MSRKILKYTLITLLSIFIVIQLFQIEKTNPPVVASQDFLAVTRPPEDVADMIKNACYDCHSHQTEYPWYSNIQPVGWWLKDHIEHAQEELNFSIWATYSSGDRAHLIEEAAEEVEKANMPLPTYTFIHEPSDLTDIQRGQLVAWFKSQPGDSPE